MKTIVKVYAASNPLDAKVFNGDLNGPAELSMPVPFKPGYDFSGNDMITRKFKKILTFLLSSKNFV